MPVNASEVDLVVRRVDLRDDEEAAAAHRVEAVSQLVERPWDESDRLESVVARWRYDDPAERLEMWGAWVGDTLAGVAWLYFPLEDNTDKAWFLVHVDPRHRRQGLGTALVGQVTSRMAEEGRHELIAEAMVPLGSEGGHPYERFAAATGFTLESTEPVRVLHLPVPDEVLHPLEASAREKWSDAYRVETHEGGLPDELVGGYCRVSNLLGVDAPSGAVEYEAETLTPERYAGYIELERELGRQRITTVAVERATGEVVAYTDLMMHAGTPNHAGQWGTLVDEAHRGHRLGMAVKAANLRRLQEEHPERKEVVTGNDETNQWMVSINVDLGFELRELCREYRRVLPA